MNAKQLQEAIVQNIAEFLDRAEHRMEAMQKLPDNRHVIMRFLRDQLNDEIGPTSRFRLIGTTTDAA